MSMLVLAFDTAMAACSAAVARFGDTGTQVLAAHHETRTRGHAEVLVPMIAGVMAEAELGFTDLDRIAVTTGPGTFTGVRIGVATARGMAVASGLPVVGVTTLEAVAAGALRAAGDARRAIASIFDARRGEVYLQCFSASLAPLTQARVLSYEDAWRELRVHRPILVGNGAELVAPQGETVRAINGVAGIPDQPTAVLVAERGALQHIPDKPVVPLYLRPPDAKLPQQARRG